MDAKTRHRNYEFEHLVNSFIFTGASVGDRGLVSTENLEELERNGFDWILALKKRRNREVSDLLLGGRQLIFCRESEDLKWSEVIGGDGIRYIVCRNPVVAEEQTSAI